MQMRSMKAIVIVLVGCAIIFGAIFGFIYYRNSKIKEFLSTRQTPAVAVTVATAEEVEWEQFLTAIGTLHARNGVDVSPEVTGMVVDIRFESGQMVRKGDVLLNLDAEQERANLQSQQAEQTYASITASRYRVLSRGDVVSQATRDKAESDLQSSTAQIAALNAQIEKKIIRAPFDGVLGVRQVDVGQYLQAGTPIVNIQDLSVMYCDFTLSQKELSNIKVGQRLVLSVDAYANRTFIGTIQAIEPRIDPTSGMISVRGQFDNEDGLLRPGMFSTVEVVLPQKARVVAVPQQAITYNLSGDTVYLVERASDALKRQEQQTQRQERRAPTDTRQTDAGQEQTIPESTSDPHSVSVSDNGMSGNADAPDGTDTGSRDADTQNAAAARVQLADQDQSFQQGQSVDQGQSVGQGETGGTNAVDTQTAEAPAVAPGTAPNALVAQRINVRVLRENGELVAVEGVQAGQQVVTSGQLKLRNGSQVDIVPDDPAQIPQTIPLN